LLLKLEIFEEAAICIKSENLTPTDYITPEKDDYYLCLARFLTTQKRFEEALSVLKTLENLENSMQIYYRLATVHILQAIVYLRMQRRSIAREYLAKAVTLVSNQKLYRTFLDEDPLIAELLLEVRSTNARFVDELLAMYRQPKLSESPLVEPLSEREQEILRLIAQGLNNREIGERLILAVGTVKRHAVNIFGKLEVNSRTEAVARARDLGLL
jgi:LuxR family maltose regulon positive regulatory protein